MRLDVVASIVDVFCTLVTHPSNQHVCVARFGDPSQFVVDSFRSTIVYDRIDG